MPSKTEIELGLYRLAGEPYFMLMARDPDFAPLIQMWVNRREADIRCGNRPGTDIEQVTNAKVILAEGAAWRLKNNGAWLKPFVSDSKDRAVSAAPTAGTPGNSVPNTALNIPMPSGAQKPTLITAPVLPTAAVAPPQQQQYVPPPPPPIPNAVFMAIREAANTVSVDLGTMLAFAKIESNFNPKATAKAGTAAGLYQFTHATWSDAVNSYGSKYKVSADMVLDASANALMAAERIKAYADYLRVHQLPSDAGNMYCLHFLGMLGGVRLINAAAMSIPVYAPGTLASQVFPIAATANPEIFGKLTLKEVYNKLYRGAQNLADAYTASIGIGGPIITA